MRTETCLTCDRVFTPIPRHPMVESAWCPDCWRAIYERMQQGLWLGQVLGLPIAALRAEDV